MRWQFPAWPLDCGPGMGVASHVGCRVMWPTSKLAWREFCWVCLLKKKVLHLFIWGKKHVHLVALFIIRWNVDCFEVMWCHKIEIYLASDVKEIPQRCFRLRNAQTAKYLIDLDLCGQCAFPSVYAFTLWRIGRSSPGRSRTVVLNFFSATPRLSNCPLFQSPWL